MKRHEWISLIAAVLIICGFVVIVSKFGKHHCETTEGPVACHEP